MLTILTLSLVAQVTAYTVAAYPASATNPTTATPLAAPVTYPMTQVACNLPKTTETLPIIDPYEGRLDDPANPGTRDCAVPIEAQVRALPTGTGYKIAVRGVNEGGPGAWSTFTSPFAVTAVQAHACDGTPPTTGSVVAGARTLDWCWNGLDANGVATTVTTWTVTLDGTPLVLTGVTVGATANTQGKRLYSAPLTVAAGTRVIRIAGTNAAGQAAFSAVYTATVTQPPAAPSVAEIRGLR